MKGKERKNKTTIYTIGHSKRTLKEFLDLLKRYRIKQLIDVRRWPTSKWSWFKKENLECSLRRAKIKYFWLGQQLGGFRKESYKAWLKSKEFKAGLEQLIRLSKKARTCLMCAERLWFRCHRRFIADELKRHKLKVLHILNEQRVVEHS